MKLNEKKSGIVEFVSRKMRTTIKQEQFQGFPICKEYKYLGVKFTYKLSMKNQLNYIKNKSRAIFQKLSPFLYRSDLDTKKSMWQVLVQPLIEFVLPLYCWETASSNLKYADSVIRSSFKLFSGLKNNTEDDVVDMLSGYNFKQRALLLYDISMQKWNFRKTGLRHQYQFLPQEIQNKLNSNKVNTCKKMPNELIHYLNTTKSICQKCHTPNSFLHLREKHNCVLPDLKTLLQMTSPIQRAKMSRREGITKLKEVLKPLLYKMRQCINGVKQQTMLVSHAIHSHNSSLY